MDTKIGREVDIVKGLDRCLVSVKTKSDYIRE